MTKVLARRNSWKTCLQLLGCLLFPLCTIFIMAEGLMGSVRQVWAYSYSETLGTITRSQLKTDEDSRLIDVEYLYEVLGKKYQGNQYCYGAVSTNTSVWDNIQQNLPVGLQVSVYYQSNKPEEAVLVQGLMGFHGGLLWFASLFIFIGPFIWHCVIEHPKVFDPADKRLIAHLEHGWVYRPNGRNWWRYYFAGMLAISFAGSFIFFPHNMPLKLIASAVVMLLLLPCLIASRLVPQVAVRADLVNQSWTLFTQRKTITIPIGAIHDITVQQQMEVNATGPDEATNYFRVIIEWYNAEAELQQTRLDKWYGANEAKQVAEWLKQQAKTIAPFI